ncbi:hypothetical protein AALO_G00258600, partial [Alosa alosa]
MVEHQLVEHALHARFTLALQRRVGTADVEGAVDEAALGQQPLLLLLLGAAEALRDTASTLPLSLRGQHALKGKLIHLDSHP